MLKIEKVSQNNIAMRLRKKERFLTSFFWKAFGLAFAIHLIGFVGIKIKSNGMGILSQNPPVVVVSDANIPFEKNIFLQKNDHLHKHYLEPTGTQLFSINYSYPTAGNDLESYPFTYAQELSREITPWKPSIEVNVSGPLAENEMVDNGIVLFNSKLQDPFVIKYKTQIDNKTGKILWYESEVQNSLAEEILGRMRFKPNEHQFVSSGEIEIRYY